MSINFKNRESIAILRDDEKFSMLEKIHKDRLHIDFDCFALLLEDKNNGIREKAKNIILDSSDADTIREMVAYLSSRNPETRNIIVEILYELVDLNLDAIERLTHSRDEDLRIYACQILGHSRDERAIAMLKKMIHDKSPNVRNAAAMAFESSDQRFDISFLIDALKEEKEEWVKFSIIEIIDNKGGKSFLPELLKLAECEPEYIKLEILRLFKKFGQTDSLTRLIEHKDLYPDVLFSDFNDCIITILNKIPGTEKIIYDNKITDHILQIIEKDDNPWNRYESIKFLSSSRPIDFIELFKRFADDKHPLVRIASIDALSRSDNKDNLRFIQRYLNDEDEEVRRLAKKICKDEP